MLANVHSYNTKYTGNRSFHCKWRGVTILIGKAFLSNQHVDDYK